MSKARYWNDPKIAHERDRELERALPTKRKLRKAREESNGASAEQKTPEMRQAAQQKSPVH